MKAVSSARAPAKADSDATSLSWPVPAAQRDECMGPSLYLVGMVELFSAIDPPPPCVACDETRLEAQ